MKLSDIPDAYNLQEAERDCAGIETVRAVAWFENGQLEWRTINAASDHVAIELPQKRMVKCIVCNPGDQQMAWDAETVRHALLNAPGTAKGEGWNFMPSQDTIFDKDLDDSAWFDSDPATLHERCRNFANGVQTEVERLRRLAVETLDGFAACLMREKGEHREEDSATPPPPLNAQRAAYNLKSCVDAAQKLLLWLEVKTIFPDEVPDSAIALRQGLRIGLSLASVVRVK